MGRTEQATCYYLNPWTCYLKQFASPGLNFEQAFHQYKLGKCNPTIVERIRYSNECCFCCLYIVFHPYNIISLLLLGLEMSAIFKHPKLIVWTGTANSVTTHRKQCVPHIQATAHTSKQSVISDLSYKPCDVGSLVLPNPATWYA